MKHVGVDMQLDEFKVWLIGYKNYSTRVSSNIASRLRRVVKLLGKTSVRPTGPDLLISELNKSEEFQAFSYSIKSQLRKSVKLYAEYNNRK